MTLHTFDKVLLENGNQLEQIDKYINILTICLPVRIPVTELLCEAAVSSTAILQTYRNQIIAKLTGKRCQDLRSKFLQSQFNMRKQYKLLAYILSLVKSTELLVEMAATFGKGSKGKWRAVIGLETLKAALRMAMLGISRRPLPASIPVHNLELDQDQVTALVRQDSKEPGSAYANFKLFGDISTQRIQLKSLDQDSVRPPGQLLRKLTPQLTIAEALSILRPVVYSVLLYRYRDRKRSWTPWLLGIAMEFFSKELAKGSFSGDTNRPITKLERSVYQERQKDMVWWLMRGAFFEHYTRGFITGIANKLENVAVLNFVGTLLLDAVDYFDESYFASATL